LIAIAVLRYISVATPGTDMVKFGCNAMLPVADGMTP